MSRPVWIDGDDGTDDEAPITQAGMRMKRKRKREANAVRFWELRLKTGTCYWAAIADALEHAPGIVESARVEVVSRLSDLAAHYPDRAEAVTVTETKNEKSYA